MNFLNHFILSFYIISFSQISKSDIWIKDINSDLFEFTTHLTSLDSTNLSYGKNLLKLKRANTKKFQIKKLILKAQEYYLSGEMDKALEVFKEITSLSHKADWNKEQRRVILYSFLRRAQNENDIHKKQALLLSASQFMPSKIIKDYPDYHLFPPPLLKELEQTYNNQIFLSVSLKKLFPQHEIILINGKLFSPEKKILKIPESSYRITALSSSHTSWTKVIPISHLLTQSIKTKSLTTGYCKTLKLKYKWILKKTRIFYNKNCENKDPLNSLKREDGKPPEHVSNKNRYKKLLAFIKSLPTWLIVGSAILTTGIILSLTINKDDKSSSKVLF